MDMSKKSMTGNAPSLALPDERSDFYEEHDLGSGRHVGNQTENVAKVQGGKPNPLRNFHTIDSDNAREALSTMLEGVKLAQARGGGRTTDTQSNQSPSVNQPRPRQATTAAVPHNRKRFLLKPFAKSAVKQERERDNELARQRQQREEKEKEEKAAAKKEEEEEQKRELKQKLRDENEQLRARVARLEMDQMELGSLQHKMRQLEWAIDVVRHDADRVRDDALTQPSSK